MRIERDVTIAGHKCGVYANLAAGELTELESLKIPAHNRAVHKRVIAGELGDNPRFYCGFKGNGYEDATRLMRDGWPKGATRVREICEVLHAPEPREIRRRMRWSDDGDEMDRDRMRAGLIDSMWRTTRRERVVSSPIVTLEGHWGGRAHCQTEDFFWQGAVMAVISNALENAGYQVEIYASNLSVHEEARRQWTLVRVCAKEAGSPLRLETLAGVLCHGGIYRTFGFLAKLQASFSLNMGFGSTREIPETLGRELAVSGRSILVEQTYSEDAARREINRILGIVEKGEIAA